MAKCRRFISSLTKSGEYQTTIFDLFTDFFNAVKNNTANPKGDYDELKKKVLVIFEDPKLNAKVNSIFREFEITLAEEANKHRSQFTLADNDIDMIDGA